MSTKDRLQIILITYNRSKHVRKTLEQFFTGNSPVKDYDFIVLDNNSTDNTEVVVKEFISQYSNIKYIKNNYNLGLSGNIERAMEIASKDYVWIIGDDDKYDFSNWTEVEKAINNNEKMICIARYALDDRHKNNPANQLFQLTFITGGIYSTSLFNDITIKNALDSIYTLFPHVPPIIAFLNNGGKIYVIDKPIADNGMDVETTDISYTRGVKDKTELYERTNDMTWVLGYANILTLLKNKKLQQDCIEVAIPYKDIYGSWENFYNCVQNQYINSGKINYFLEIYNILPDEHKKHFDLINTYVLSNEYKNLNKNLDSLVFYKNNNPKFFEQIFSVKNDGKHKVLKILGIKMKFRRK